MTDRELMQQALDALDCIYSPLHVREINKVGAAIAALRERLAQQEPEPFAWANLNELAEQFNSVNCGTAYRLPGDGLSPLYTSTPKCKHTT